jgi:peptidoglycan/LPS O-acetylase OafA/YrhL
VSAGERATTGPLPLRARILRLFTRITTSGAFIPEIDGLRFIAIGSVVLFHLMEALKLKAPLVYVPGSQNSLLARILANGFHGVELFFVISGFILALPFAGHHLKSAKAVSLRGYFLRRLTRLEPPYVLSLLLIAALMVGVKGEDFASTLPSLAASMFYLHNLIFGAPSAVNNVAWSLEIEIQFYVLVPLLAWVFAIRNKVVRRSVLSGTIVLLTIGAWALFSPDSPRGYLSILRFLQFFLTGFLLADFYLCDWHGRVVSRNFAWDIVCALGWTFLVSLWLMPELAPLPARYLQGDSFVAALLFPPLTLLVYIAAFRGRISNWIFTRPAITIIGGMCYTIYLLHNTLISAAVDLTRDIAPTGSFEANFLVQCLIVVPVVLALCAVYFLLIEKPCMQRDWPKRLYGRIASAFSGRRQDQRSTDPGEVG